MMRTIIILLCCVPMHAANIHVRPSADVTFDGDGTTWAAAASGGAVGARKGMPSTLVRGNTYYIADGSYGAYDFDDNESGTTSIVIKKATTSEHGSETGWVSTMGDGQATWGDLAFYDGYQTFDGATRDEGNWASQTAYGFRVVGTIVMRWDVNSIFGRNITVRYTDVGGAHSSTYSASIPDEGFYIVGDSGTDEVNFTISRCYLHNTRIPVQMRDNGATTIEYCYFGDAWGKEAIRGGNAAEDIIIRYNIFKNTCQDDPDDPSSNGATAEIAIWDGAGPFDTIEIYGNLIWNTMLIDHSDGVIMLGTAPGVEATNCKIYNNTIAGIQEAPARVFCDGDNIAVFNILFYDCAGTPSVDLTGTGNTTGNNGEEASNPFVDYAGGNFHLSAALAGTSLSSPYNTDLDGVTRGGDGVFDRGAFEYGSAPATINRNVRGVVNLRGSATVR